MDELIPFPLYAEHKPSDDAVDTMAFLLRSIYPELFGVRSEKEVEGKIIEEPKQIEDSEEHKG
jgi:hypothetical protein